MADGDPLGLLEEVGFAAATAHAGSVVDGLTAELARLPVVVVSDLRPAHRSHIVAFTTGSAEGDAALARRLAEADVVVSHRPNGIRMAAHFWNTRADLDRLLATVGSTPSPSAMRRSPA